MKKLIVTLAALLLLPNVTNATTGDEIDYDSLPITSSSVVYYKTTIINGLPLVEEVTEDEYNGVIPPLDGGAADYGMVESTYKRLGLYVSTLTDTTYFVTAELDWKILPITRSYDVFAIRLGHYLSMADNSQAGVQVYKKNGVVNNINYSYNGTNILKESDGFGISMNLVDGATAYTNQIQCIISSDDVSTMVYASYQHATENVSLATSQRYDIHAGGLGDVIYFENGVSNYYDMMPGTYSYINR